MALPTSSSPLPATERRDRRGIAAVIVGIQAAVLTLVVLRLLRTARENRTSALPRAGRREIGGAVIVAIVVVAAIVACVGLARRRDWGRTLTYVVQGVLAALGLALLFRRPFVGVVLLAVAALVSWLTSSGRPPNRFVPPPVAPLPPSSATPGQPEVTGSSLAIGLATLAAVLVALSIRSQLVFGLVVLAMVFVPLERLFSLHPQRVLRERWKTDVVHLICNQVLTTIGLIVVAGSAIVALHWAINADVQRAIAAQPGWLQLIEGLAIADVAGYWAHRATHAAPFLWRFHKVHHSIEEMDWLAAGRLHPIDQAFTRACTVVPLYVLGFSQATFGAALVVLAFGALLIHANVRTDFGPLRWVVASPQWHHWHHAGEAGALDKNFSGLLPVVDVVFGTAHLPKRWPTRYGIGEPTPDGYLRQLAWPFH